MNSTNEQLQSIWTDWIALWNGDLDRASRIAADDYQIHMVPMDGSDLSTYAGPGGLAAWIKQLHMLFSPLRFTVQVAPLFQGDMIAGRWVTTGTYAGASQAHKRNLAHGCHSLARTSYASRMARSWSTG